MIADGFGIHAKLIGDLAPRPENRAITADFEDLPQLPFDEYGSTSSPPTAASSRPRPAAASTGPRPTSSPGTNLLPDQNAQFGLSIDRGPGGGALPGRNAALQARGSRPAPRTRTPAASATSPEARPRRRRPVPRRPQLHDAARADRLAARHHLLPGGRRSPPPPQKLGRAEQAARAARRSSQIGTTNVAAGPGCHPFHAVGKMYLAGPFKGAPLQPGRGHPGPGRPLRLRRRRRPRRDPRRPARRPRHRRLRHGAVDHRRHPDPDALDPGQHRQAELHDQPDQLLRR